MPAEIRVRRIYEDPVPEDGARDIDHSQAAVLAGLLRSRGRRARS
jgi:hypothetical protein